jgi:hypothetical protein
MCTHDADAKQDPPACPRVQSGIHAVLDGPYPLVAYERARAQLGIGQGWGRRDRFLGNRSMHAFLDAIYREGENGSISTDMGRRTRQTWEFVNDQMGF